MSLPNLGFTYRWEPADSGAKKTLLLLHGTGGNENDLIDLGKLVAPGFNLLSPRGKVSENGLTRFFKRKSVGIFDVEDLKHRAIDLANFTRKARLELGIGNDPIVALGYSNGANIASGVIFEDPEVLQGAILLRPMVPYLVGEIDFKKIKILMISGVLDSTMNPDEPEKLEKIYRDYKAEITSHSLSVSHGLSTEDIRISKDWIKRNF